ncbi:hypothetical protein KF134_1808 [Lactococcus lactis subsp. lactis]|nr:hypothetical protein KF134_1808 [Lactococcus lactis subsp. lactis]
MGWLDFKQAFCDLFLERNLSFPLLTKILKKMTVRFSIFIQEKSPSIYKRKESAVGQGLKFDFSFLIKTY